MNREFLELYVAVMLCLGILVGVLSRLHPIRAYRRWQIRRELSAQEQEIREALRTQGYWVAQDAHNQWLGEGIGEPLRRRQLDSAATSQDRYSRRIH